MNRILIRVLILAAIATFGSSARAAVTIVTDLLGAAHTDLLITPFQRNVHTTSGPIADQIHFLAGDPNSPAAYAKQTVRAAANSGSIALESRSAVAGSFNGLLVSYSPVAANGAASVRMEIDDVIFTGPGPIVTVGVMLEVSGTLTGTASISKPGAIAHAGSTLSIGARLQTPPSPISQRSFLAEQIGGQAPTSGIVIDTHILAGVEFPATLAIAPVTVPTNQPHTLHISVHVQTGASLNYEGVADGVASGDALFGATVNFPTSGPVFILPPGFTANSISAAIANNAWLGTPVSLIPLPAAAWLFASGLAAFCLTCRRKRGCAAPSL